MQYLALCKLFSLLSLASGFVSHSFGISNGNTAKTSSLFGKNKDAEVSQAQALPIGAFVEFKEKDRSIIGKIDKVEHKSSGGARYRILDTDNKPHNVAAKSIEYSMACPNSPGQATKLFDEFTTVHEASQQQLQKSLEISPDLIEMVWETVAEEEHSEVTPNSFVELIHSHAASTIEKYMAWKLLRTEMAHIFFREIKDHGIVVSFKARAKNAVVAAKKHFCATHIDDNEICFV